MTDFITLGIGPSSDIPTFVLFGLSPVLVSVITLTLYARALTLALEDRSAALTLYTRPTTLTMEDR